MTIDLRLGEFVSREEFARMVGKSTKTISRWMGQPDGLPYLDLGNEKPIPIQLARDWLAGRIRRPNPRGQKAK